MTRELGLRGSALIIYAIIYSFSADGKGTFFGSREALAEFAGVSVSTTGKMLKELLKDEFIYAVEGKNFEHKEYKVNLNKIKNGSRILPVAQPKSTCGAAENYPRRSQNLPAAQPNFTPNNKPYNKPIINIYNGAKAPEEEKKKEVLREDLEDEKETPFAADTESRPSAEKKPIDTRAQTSPAEARSKATPGYSKNYRNARKQGADPKAEYKHCNFDPEEAFRRALERSERWMQEVLADIEAEKKEKEAAGEANEAHTDTNEAKENPPPEADCTAKASPSP